MDTALELVGLALIAAAGFLVAVPLGVALSGAAALLVGYLLERRS